MDQSFQEFLATQNVDIPIFGFIINLFIAAALSFILRGIYVKFGQALSDRKTFGRNLILISTTTMLIITVVKSSLALSLGLVGALSIVRFRTAIKEPEELAYLFLAIAIGLGLGANQIVTTLVAFPIITGIICLTRLSGKSDANQNLYLTIASHNPQKVELDDIVQILNKHCTSAVLRRFDDSKELLEATFLVEFDNFPKMEAAKKELKATSDDIKITFLQNKNLGS